MFLLLVYEKYLHLNETNRKTVTVKQTKHRKKGTAAIEEII